MGRPAHRPWGTGVSGWTRITCEERDTLRSDNQHVGASLTNFVGGEVLDPRLPPHTHTEWWRGDRAVLIDRLDTSGCTHWKFTPADPEGDCTTVERKS